MAKYLIDIYGETKDFEETKIDKQCFSMSCEPVKQGPNSYTVRVDLNAVNEEEEINYQLWEGLFKNKRWFRVSELDEKDEVVAVLNLLRDVFEKVEK